jgi:epoxyqueuosine reductase QueG
MNSPNEQAFPSCTSCGTHADVPDNPVQVCHDCQAGCTSRRTDKSTEEEISAGPYLLFAAVVMILISLAIRWLV